MSKKILIIGATGSIGNKLRKTLLEKTDYELTLFSRNVGKIKIDATREKAISGNVNNKAELEKVIKDQDVVFAALSGNLREMAKNIVETMKKLGNKRLIFISSMGIYNEIPVSIGGNLSENPILKPYREAADIIESSDLNYTVIRPGWFDEGSNEYEITKKGEKFGGHNVSRQAIANLVLRLIEDEEFGVRESLGVNRPEIK